MDLTTRKATFNDFQQIVRVTDTWWGGPTSEFAHPIFFYELGQMARVTEHKGELVGFLLGFIANDATVGYVHLVGIHPDYRRKGVAKALYASFEKDCRKAGCKELKSITRPANEGSVHFHRALGWSTEEVPDYAGPDRARTVLRKRL